MSCYTKWFNYHSERMICCVFLKSGTNFSTSLSITTQANLFVIVLNRLEYCYCCCNIPIILWCACAKFRFQREWLKRWIWPLMELFPQFFSIPFNSLTVHRLWTLRTQHTEILRCRSCFPSLSVCVWFYNRLSFSSLRTTFPETQVFQQRLQ